MLNLFRSRLARSIIAGVVLIVFLFGLTVSVIGYRVFTEELEEQYATTGLEIARMTRGEFYLNNITDFFSEETQESEAFAQAMTWVKNYTNYMGVEFIYLIVPSEDYSTIKFVFSSMNEDSDNTQFEPGYVRKTSSDEYKEKYKRLMEGQSDGENVFRDARQTETGAHVTSMVPVLDQDTGETLGILCVQSQMENLNSARERFLFRTGLMTILTGLFIILLYSWFLTRNLVRPIRKISDETIRFSRENKLPEVLVSEGVKGNTEIKNLALHVDKMEMELVQNMENLKAVTSQKNQLEGELHVASGIQQGIIPNTFPPFPDRDEFSLFASMEPAKEVGGDFYDFFLIDDTHLALVMADVSGKGAPAALFMMASKILIKNRALMGGTPKEILEDVNDQLCEGNDSNMFVTTWLGILDVETGVLTTANAGHEYPAICKADGTFELFKDRHGFVLAGMHGSKYREETLVLQPGDSIFVYTDGVAEAADEEDNLFGTERMLETLNTSPHASPDELLYNMMGSIGRFVQGAPQADDITMLALQYKGPRLHLKTLKLEAVTENLPEVETFVSEILETLDAPAKTSLQYQMAVEELFVNIAKYAYAPGVGDVIIRMGYDPDTNTLMTAFLDRGAAYNPLEREDPDVTLSAEEREVGGLGIFLVRQTMDGVQYHRNDGWNMLTIQKCLSESSGEEVPHEV